MKLAEVQLGSECTVDVSFQVPDVPPGTYHVTALIYEQDGYGVEAERSFTVTP